MSYIDKMSRAKDLILAHFTAFYAENGDQKAKEMASDAYEAFALELQKIGGTDEASLAECRWEDLNNTCKLPLLLAKRVATIFRESQHDPEAAARVKTGYVSPAQAARLDVAALIGRYNPEEPDSAVTKRLVEISKGQAVVVFTDDGSVDPVNTEKLIEEVRKGYPPRSTIIVDGRPRRLYKVGERANNLVDENPLYPGRPLLPDGTCDQTQRSWAGVPLEVRQLVRVIVAGASLVTLDKAHDLIDRAVTADAEKTLRQRYPSASLEFDTMKEEGKLPTLKVALNKVVRTNDPFNRTY